MVWMSLKEDYLNLFPWRQYPDQNQVLHKNNENHWISHQTLHGKDKLLIRFRAEDLPANVQIIKDLFTEDQIMTSGSKDEQEKYEDDNSGISYCAN